MATQQRFTKVQPPKDINDLYEQFKALADEFNKFIDFNKIADSGITTAKIADSAITAAKIATGAVTSAKILDGTIATGDIADDAVTDAKLRESAALSVIGRSANSTGNPADITAGSDGHILRRSGTTLGFGTIASAGIANNAVTFSKLDAANMVSATSTTVNLSSGLVDATEESAMEATLSIPTAWAGYNVFLSASFRIVDSGNTTTRLNFRFRRGSGTGGTAIYQMTNCDYDSAAANDVVSRTLTFMDTGLTSTGSVTYTLTASDSDNDDVKTMDVGSFTLIAIRTS